MIMGFLSARMNPGLCIAELILGEMNWIEFVASLAGEFLGAFVGAVLVWIHFVPHFKTVPKPYSMTPDGLLLDEGNGLSPTALDLSSYNPRKGDIEARNKGLARIGDAMNDISFYLKGPNNGSPTLRNEDLAQKVGIGGKGLASVENGLTRRSVQVCDVHKRLESMDMEEFKKMMLPSSSHSDTSSGVERGVEETLNSTKKRLDQLYDAAVVADKNAKLSIFATRPAIYSPLFNFLCETLCSTALIFTALMVGNRAKEMQPDQAALYNAQEGVMIGFFIFVMVLGLGGPTGFAANAARDFGPRLAHHVLPIPGKGISEFYYAWVPFAGSFVGGSAGAGLYAAIQSMNKSEVSTLA